MKFIVADTWAGVFICTHKDREVNTAIQIESFMSAPGCYWEPMLFVAFLF